MANATYELGQALKGPARGAWGATWVGAARAAGPPLLFAVRLWVSVCFALYVAFWLQLDNAYWAGTSAAIVCQPQLGASLRKAWFRMVGTIVGAVIIVVLNACFPQDRIAFLTLLALWLAICAFAATLMRNFASYAAALAGYTAAIIAADTLGATGGPDGQVFMLAVTRASEICIGIVCAGIVLAGTDFGAAQRQLTGLFATLAAEITSRFAGMLTLAGSCLDTRAQRRELARRVIALDPAVDLAIGESSQLRYHSPVLQRAVEGLFAALDGWRTVAAHLSRLPDSAAQQEAEAVLFCLPPALRSAPESASSARWIADPIGLRGACEQGKRRLLALPAGTPSQRLLADQTAKLLAGLVQALDGLILLVDAGRPLRGHRRFRLSVADWAPSLVNGGRAFVAIGAIELFWIVTAWPSGVSAIVFSAVTLLLLSPKGDQAYAGAMAFALGVAGAVPAAAIVKFAVLPGLETFPAFCFALGLCLVPVGFVMVQSRKPLVLAVVTAMGFNFMPLLAPTNEMSYDTAAFYNSALAIVVGCVIAPLSFRLLPPLSPSLRAGQLLALTLRDLRRLAIGPLPRRPEAWQGGLYGRLEALPEQAEPLQRAHLLAALSVGEDIMQLRAISPLLDLGPELGAALAALAQSDCAAATTWLARLDHRLASAPGAEFERRPRASGTRQDSLPVRDPSRTYRLFRHRSGGMRFAEIDLFGVYVAPISLLMVAAWLVTIAMRRVASRFGVLRYVWHRALFVFAVYMIVLSSTVLIVARQAP